MQGPRWRLVLLGLALFGGCGGPGASSQDRRQTMQDQAEIVKALRGIGDAALNSSDKGELESLGYQALSGKEFDGLALRAPGRVDVRKQSTLRAIIAVEQSEDRARAMPLLKNGVAVITRLGSGGCWFALPYADPAEKNPLPPDEEPPPPPPSGASDMRIQGVRVVDLRAEGMPWETGRYAVRIISANWKSNTEIVTMSDDQQTATQVPRRIKVEAGDFAKSAGHPALKGLGAELNIPAKGATAYGSVRLKKDAGWPVTEAGTPVIPVAILLKRQGILNPVKIELYAPTSGGDEAEAWVTIDLRKAAPQVAATEKCWVYLIAGEHLAGPVELAK